MPGAAEIAPRLWRAMSTHGPAPRRRMSIRSHAWPLRCRGGAGMSPTPRRCVPKQ